MRDENENTVLYCTLTLYLSLLSIYLLTTASLHPRTRFRILPPLSPGRLIHHPLSSSTNPLLKS